VRFDVPAGHVANLALLAELYHLAMMGEDLEYRPGDPADSAASRAWL
jgi:hypothetical protein